MAELNEEQLDAMRELWEEQEGKAAFDAYSEDHEDEWDEIFDENRDFVLEQNYDNIWDMTHEDFRERWDESEEKEEAFQRWLNDSEGEE